MPRSRRRPWRNRRHLPVSAEAAATGGRRATSRRGQRQWRRATREEEAVESVGGADALEEVQERMPRFRRQYKIQEVIKRRQVMLVQVVKEERGNKGAALTTYLSLAGRYSVLMPNTARGGGISRKITSAEDRSRLKEIAQDLEVPEGMGVILRTAGASRTKTEVKRDFEYLLRLWENVRDLTLKSTAPTLVYEEGSLVKRSIRDLYSKDIDEIVVAGEDGYKECARLHAHAHAEPRQAREALQGPASRSSRASASRASSTRCSRRSCSCAPAATSSSTRPKRWSPSTSTPAARRASTTSRTPRSRPMSRRPRKSPASCACAILPALSSSTSSTWTRRRNNRTVERRLKDALKHDRARIQVGRISHFGLLEMSRQRIRTSVLESLDREMPGLRRLRPCALGVVGGAASFCARWRRC